MSHLRLHSEGLRRRRRRKHSVMRVWTLFGSSCSLMTLTMLFVIALMSLRVASQYVEASSDSILFLDEKGEDVEEEKEEEEGGEQRLFRGAAGGGSITKTLPPTVTIELLSPSTIDSECLHPTDGSDATLNIRCRTIILGMYGGTFPIASRALTAVVQNRMIRPAFFANRLAFGVAQRWGEIVDAIKVSTVTIDGGGDQAGGSLMFLELPNMASFDMSQAEDILIDTSIKDLVQSSITPSSGVIRVSLERKAPDAVNWRIVAFGYASMVPSVIASLQPFAPTASELQYLLLFSISPSCSFPYVRSLSSEMHRIVFPSVEAGSHAEASTQLLHNVMITVFVCMFQIFLVVILKIVIKCNFPTSMALLYFPSVYVSVSLFLLPGIAHSSAKLVFYGEDGGKVVGGLAGLIYCSFVAGGMPYLSRRYFRNVMMRETSEHLLDFPKALQLVMPTQSWGPSPRVNSFLVPCAMIKSNDKMRQNWRPFAVAVVMGVLTAIEVSRPVWCAVQAAAVFIVSVGVPVLDVWKPLYRCPALGYFGSATLAFTSLAVLTFFIHGVRPIVVTQAESPLTVMIVTVVFSVFLRSICTLLVGLLELVIVRPRVWPAGELMPNLEVMVVSDSDDEEEAAARDAATKQNTAANISNSRSTGEFGGGGNEDNDLSLELLSNGKPSEKGSPPLRLTDKALAAVVGTDEKPIDLREVEGSPATDPSDGTAMFAGATQRANLLEPPTLNDDDEENGHEMQTLLPASQGSPGSSRSHSQQAPNADTSSNSHVHNPLDSAKDFIKGRLRTLSHIVEEKARENSKAMLDSDDDYAPPNVVPKRRIRRSELLAGHLPDADTVEKLREAMEEAEQSYDHHHSVETKQMQRLASISAGGSGGGGGIPNGSFWNSKSFNRSFANNSGGNSFAPAESNTVNSNSMMFGSAANLAGGAGGGAGGGGGEAAGNSLPPHVAPKLGPIPPVDPSVSKRVKAMVTVLEEDTAGGGGGGKGVKFQIGGGGGKSSSKVPLSNILQGKGPMPPDLVEIRRREYEML